jgi:acetoin utilization protein AcuC
MSTFLYSGDALARYGFPAGHPFGADRQAAFLNEARHQNLLQRALQQEPRSASAAEIARFHTPPYVAFVQRMSERGSGSLDYGDTPAFPGVYEAAATVVGSALAGLEAIMAGHAARTFQPIGGLHHARRERAAGFCVFNDIGVIVDTLRSHYGIQRIAYVDIDVHHGDGVFYPYEDDPELIFADIHQDGDTLYPGTGAAHETGKGAAAGTKLNIPLPPGAGDEQFAAAWQRVLAHLDAFRPSFVILQCGADSLAGDPLASLRYTPAVHARAARDLCAVAQRHAAGRIMGLGGGGYDRNNLALAWCGVLREFLDV